MEKSGKKALILIIIAGVIVVGIITLIKVFTDSQEEANNVQQQATEEFVEVLEDGTKLNVSNKLEEVKTFEGMEITDIQITEKDNVTLLLGTVTNKSDKNQGGYPVEVVVLNKEGKEIKTVAAYIKELKPGESTQLSTSATSDYANAYDFTIRKK